jgi:type IV pilus assembly protein PilM
MAATALIGLDIGSMSIRAVEAGRGKDGPVVTNFGQAPLPPGAMRGGVMHDDNAVTLALKQLWTNARFRSRKVVLGITNPQVVVREMSVANLPERELRRSLPFQVRDSLPLPVERSLLDFHPLEDPGHGDTVRGLLIAAPKDMVLTAVHAVERAGLHVVRVDLASFALLRATSRTDGQVEALVDIGAQSTSVVVHADGEPLIVRTIPRGGAEITELVAGRLGVAVPEAESLKCRVGLRTDVDVRAAEVIREAVAPLINEVRSSFAYLNTSGRQARVARLALSGGGCLLPGLLDALRTQLGVEAVLADPTVRLHGAHRSRREDLEQFRPSAAVSIGLALGAA